MSFVLDASIAVCWAFEDEDHPAARRALERIRTDEAIVPSLWWFEVRNTLIVNERRGRIADGEPRFFCAPCPGLQWPSTVHRMRATY